MRSELTQIETQTRAATPRILSIAGLDPSGGAGIAADLKSIEAAGGYGMAAITALTAQNTHGVRAVHVPPIEFLTDQLEAISDDITIDAIKSGMLGTADVIGAVGAWLASNRPRVVVVDPVMIATSGDRLLNEHAERQMIAFCRRATVVTPNIEELARITGAERAATECAAIEQGLRFARDTGVNVVVKTGHLDGPLVTNTWVCPDGTTIGVPATRLDTTNTHGTGCSLAAALATRLGAGDSPREALEWATAWLHEAVAFGADLRVGVGNGPVDHAHRLRRLAAASPADEWDPMAQPLAAEYRERGASGASGESNQTIASGETNVTTASGEMNETSASGETNQTTASGFEMAGQRA